MTPNSAISFHSSPLLLLTCSMIRAILRNVQVGLIISASLLVVFAFQRLSLYSVPVLVGNIVHPGQPPSGDSKELVGHGHAHGQHRIFSTNVIEIGLFKIVVPFRWSSAGEEDIEEEAVRGERGNKISRKNTGQSGNAVRRSKNERRNRPRNSEQIPDVEDNDMSHTLRASRPRLQPGQPRNESEADDPLLLLHLNETLIQSNVTALPARRLLKEEKISTAWWPNSWLTRKAAEQDR